MCGRFALANNHEEIIQNLVRDGLLPPDEEHEWIDEGDFYGRYNIAPRSRAPVVRRHHLGPASEALQNVAETLEQNAAENDAAEPTKTVRGQPSRAVGPGNDATEPTKTTVCTMKWGVVPNGSSLPANALNTINARVESILEGSHLWRPLANSRRCIVVCQGYYEWQTKGKHKIPHFIRNPDPTKLLYMAGIWNETPVESEGEKSTLHSFAIVTLDAPSNMQWLHDRIPLIFSPTSTQDMDQLRFWLDPKNTLDSGITSFLEAYATNSVKGPFTVYKVPPEVGKVGQESPSFIQPVDERKDGIRASFAKQQSAKSKANESPAKRLRTPSPDASHKKARTEVSTSSPKKASAPASPSKQSPAKKPKIHDPDSRPITNFFAVSPKKAKTTPP